VSTPDPQGLDVPTVLLCIALVLAGVAAWMGTFNGVSLLAALLALGAGAWKWAAWERGR
jgi:hypothetical protein